MNVKLQYMPSEKLRQDYLMETGERLPSPASLKVDLADLTPPQRAIVVQAGINHHDVVAMPSIVIGIKADILSPGRPAFAYDPNHSSPGMTLIGGEGDFDTIPTVQEWLAMAEARLATHARWQPELDARLAAWQAEQDAKAQRKRELEQQYTALKTEWLPKIDAMTEAEANHALPESIRQIEQEMKALRVSFGYRGCLSDARHERWERLRRERVKAETEAAKTAWVQAHGSAHLKRACAGGYDCQRLYVTERAALEAPGFAVDFDDTAGWKSRACPSVEALDIADSVTAGLGSVEVVWLTEPVTEKAEVRGDYYEPYEDEFEPCEAVIIRGYLDKYALVRVV